MSARPSAAPGDVLPKPSRRAWTILASMTALAALLHLVGIGWHLPHHPQGDEKVLWLQVHIARGVEFSPTETVFARSYPSLLGRVADVLVPERASEPPHELDELRAWSLHELSWIRGLVAVLAAGLVPATWFVARRIVGEPWAFVAAGLAASSTIAVWFSSMARPHAVVAVFTTATVAASLRARASGRVVDFALAGAFAALALGTLQSGACACAAVAAAWWWNARPRWRAPLVGAAVAASLVVASLFLFLRGEPLPQIAGASGAGNSVLAFVGLGVHNVDAGYFDGGGFARFALAMRDYEPVLALLASVGVVAVVAAFRRGAIDGARRAVAWTAAAHPLAHFALFGWYGESFQRLWFPLIPALAILAAIGLRWATSGERRPRWIVVACAALVAIQLAIALKIVVLRARDDTHERAAAWIVAHPERGPFHVGPTVRLPLLARDTTYRAELPLQRKHFVPWITTNLELAADDRARIALDLRDLPVRRPEERKQLESDVAAWVTSLGPGTFVLERFFDARRPLFQTLRDELVRRGPPAARFDPIPLHVPGARPIDYMLDSDFAPEAWFAWSVLTASRLGPDVEVFEIDG